MYDLRAKLGELGANIGLSYQLPRADRADTFQWPERWYNAWRFRSSNRLIQSGIVSRSASILLSSVISLGSCGMSFAPPDIVGEQSTPEASRIADVAGDLIDHLARLRRLRSGYHVSIFSGEAHAGREFREAEALAGAEAAHSLRHQHLTAIRLRGDARRQDDLRTKQIAVFFDRLASVEAHG